MKDKSLKILLGIIAVNLTLQTINQIGLFPTAYAQSVQKVAICDAGNSYACADVSSGTLDVYNYGK